MLALLVVGVVIRVTAMVVVEVVVAVVMVVLVETIVTVVVVLVLGSAAVMAVMVVVGVVMSLLWGSRGKLLISGLYLFPSAFTAASFPG